MGRSKRNMVRQFGVYTHAKPDGAIFYVGKGNRSRSRNLKRNKWHANVVSKYGPENIIINFYECRSEKEAFCKEVQMILEYRNQGISLTNRTNGGEGNVGYLWSKKQCLEQSEKIKKVWENPENREKYKQSQRDKWKDKEYREKQSKSRKGIIRSLEMKLKIKESSIRAGKDPELRKLRSELTKRMWQDEEIRKTITQKIKAKREEPGHKEKWNTIAKRGWEIRRKNKLKEAK